ncbi:MAG TPA: 2Fe-2S iron-sulfur cluster-binding protein [Cyclobacteriaceae bacterium]|nr:2Fe-2S iron-sulfur cluster-binding protein [Cyclobacteriaceae bacterium]HRW98322.1 2Fe-2S iron-sulfur cluster-binding protein [Cyclobacteriaceae bacterium]
MVKITIENLGKKELEINNAGDTILSSIQAHYIDWMHACGAKGRCTTCKLEVIFGKENLSEVTPAEKRYMERNELKESQRLACQARVMGDIIIRVPDEVKLPHLTYTD